MRKSSNKYFSGSSSSSSSSLAKKLQPARKAWKSFTAKVQALNLPQAITTLKNAATRGLNAAIRSLLPLKHRLIMLNTKYKRGRYNYPSTAFSHNQFRHYNSPNYGPIYIDELYEEKKFVMSHAETRGKGKAADDAETSSSNIDIDIDMRGNYKGKLKVEKRALDMEEAWRAVVAMSPQLRPVDERADDFISKVREDLKMESQRSLVEFQDMLKRSV